jgi:hypothetical protein
MQGITTKRSTVKQALDWLGLTISWGLRLFGPRWLVDICEFQCYRLGSAQNMGMRSRLRRHWLKIYIFYNYDILRSSSHGLRILYNISIYKLGRELGSC